MRQKTVTIGLAFLALLACVSCEASSPGAPVAPSSAVPFHLVFQPADAAIAAELEPVLLAGVREVETYFGAPFRAPFRVAIHPDRAAFDAAFPPEWGIAHTECWMVASGVADGVQVLSPRVWKEQACEHDAADSRHVSELLAHELVHVYHGQHNPSPDFTAVTGIDWFVEGLATLASGQLAHEHARDAREALDKGLGPKDLATAWSGRYRYGVCGSLVEFLEHELGRERVIRLLGAASSEGLMAAIGMDERELLERWRAAVSAK